MPKDTKRKQEKIREAITAVIKENVAVLVARGAKWSLDQVLCQAGYASTRTGETATTLGDAILALLPVLTLDRLRSAASSAAFERVFDRDNPKRERDPMRWEDASCVAEIAMRGGVIAELS